MFLSVRGRVLVNVEALNMTESVGNYVKHRRVPVILPERGYSTYLVPAISGESIAHGYQEIVAEKSDKENIPVCNLCRKGIFLKSTNEEVFKHAFGSDPPNNGYDFERKVIKECAVEDLGGFLFAPRRGGQARGRQVKRTSCFSTGYMVPVKEALESSIIEPQLHSRYALGTKFVTREEERGQMIYYVELSSATYTFSFDLDSSKVGRITFDMDHYGEEVISSNDVRKRTEVAIESLGELILEFEFGAKKTRFLPIVEWESIAVSVSDGVWTVPSPNSGYYLSNALSKLEKTGDRAKLFVYLNKEMLRDTIHYVKKKSEELVDEMKSIVEEWKKNLKEKMPEYYEKIDWEEIVKKKLESLISKRLGEVVESEDMKYVSSIQEKYRTFVEEVEKSEKAELFYDLSEFISRIKEECGG